MTSIVYLIIKRDPNINKTQGVAPLEVPELFDATHISNITSKSQPTLAYFQFIHKKQTSWIGSVDSFERQLASMSSG